MVDIEWLDEPQKSETGLKLHSDFKQNQKYAKTFIERIRAYKIEGINLWVGGSNLIPESLLWVMYRAPRGIPIPDYGQCINLNASYADVKKNTEYYFNSYNKIAKNVIAKYTQSKDVEKKNQFEEICK